jgi:hypothetical protein
VEPFNSLGSRYPEQAKSFLKESCFEGIWRARCCGHRHKFFAFITARLRCLAFFKLRGVARVDRLVSVKGTSKPRDTLGNWLRKPKGEPNIPMTFNYSRRSAIAVTSFVKDKTTRRETTPE